MMAKSLIEAMSDEDLTDFIEEQEAMRNLMWGESKRLEEEFHEARRLGDTASVNFIVARRTLKNRGVAHT